jgi:sec-independent protein translocase protein TatA
MPGPPELLILLGVVVLLFGATKLPQLARSLGEAQHEFKRGQNEGQHELAADEALRREAEAQRARH